jgi:hypothetical protein
MEPPRVPVNDGECQHPRFMLKRCSAKPLALGFVALLGAAQPIYHGVYIHECHVNHVASCRVCSAKTRLACCAARTGENAVHDCG